MAAGASSLPVMCDDSVPWASGYYRSIFLCSYCGLTELLAADELPSTIFCNQVETENGRLVI